MKKLFFVLAMMLMFNSTMVYASSTNNVTKVQHVKNGVSLASASFEITPHSEVETGSSIIITFENATVFSQAIIDGTSSDSKEVGYSSSGYQYNENGVTWNGSDSFDKVVPYTNSGQLPYYIRRMNDKQIEVFLMNLPDIYVGNSLKTVNGSTRTPYYSIPLVVYADVEDDVDGDAEVGVEIDGNGSSISNSNFGSVNNSLATGTTTTVTTTTEATTETTTATENSLKNKVEVEIGKSEIVVNGVKVEIDAPAYIQVVSSSTMLPLRAVSQGVVGNEDCVSWEAESKTATISFNGNEVKFSAGSNVMYVNGKAVEMANGVCAEITNSRMFVPFRALGEALGASVSWEAESKTAYFN